MIVLLIHTSCHDTINDYFVINEPLVVLSCGPCFVSHTCKTFIILFANSTHLPSLQKSNGLSAEEFLLALYAKMKMRKNVIKSTIKMSKLLASLFLEQ
jgi:hypothetical protein